jgi:hypothetical protein
MSNWTIYSGNPAEDMLEKGMDEFREAVDGSPG